VNAELVFHNANVIPMTGLANRAQAVAVADGRVIAVGTNAELEPLRRDAPTVVDLAGQTLLPGLIDTHVHLVRTGLSMLGPTLPRPGTVAELLALVEAAARDHPDHDPLIVYGGAVRGLDRSPTRFDLDAVTGDRRVLLSDPSGHVSLVSSAAWQHLDAPEAPDGLLITWANKRARHWFHSRVPRARIIDGLNRAAQAATARGVTSVHAMDGGDYLGDDDVPALLAAESDLPVRLVIYPQVLNLDAVREWGLPRVGGCILLDGAYAEHTAALCEPYADTDGGRGVLFHSDAEIERFVADAHARGLQITVHAQGDAAIEQMLRAYEHAFAEHPRADHRHRIEHCGLPTDDQVERIARLGIGLGMQPVFAPSHPFLERLFGPERMQRRHQYRRLRDLGVVVGGGSDADASPIDPLLGVQTAVTLDAERRLSPYEALELFTTNAAWLAFEEKEAGGIRPGARADFAVLAEDPLTVDPTRIGGIQVLSTWLGGGTSNAATNTS
jgi:predicted amidohydrolase YtcJ